MKASTIITTLFFAVASLFADPIQVGDTKVTFEAPDEFKALSKEVMALKWPNNHAPAFAIGTSNGSTNIAYDLKPHRLPQEALPQAQKSFTQVFESSIPGIDWIQNEIIELSGQKWIMLEMTSKAVDTNIHNIMLITGFDGKMLVFNFNSTKEEFAKYEKALRESIQSIKLP